MPIKGPVIIVEDDYDDQELLKEVFQELIIPNALRFFSTCAEVLDYLMTTIEKPFIIISDINLPVMTGMQLKERINENDYLRNKNIPFVFLTTNAELKSVSQAFERMVQGYFVKPSSLQEIKETIKMIIDYWKMCRRPGIM